MSLNASTSGSRSLSPSASSRSLSVPSLIPLAATAMRRTGRSTRPLAYRPITAPMSVTTTAAAASTWARRVSVSSSSCTGTNSKYAPSIAGNGTPTAMFAAEDTSVFWVPADPDATRERNEAGTSRRPTPTEVPNHALPTRSTTALSAPVWAWASAPCTSAGFASRASRTARALR